MDKVTRENFDAGLLALEHLLGYPLEGFYGPGSMSWRVNRESAVFLGAGRAALLQIAHPWVAAALAQHSNLLHDALGRFHGTFRVVYTMVFGSRGQALAAARGLYARHMPVRGTLDDGSPYQANELSALIWVWATLVESAVMAFGFALPPLTAKQREQYYAEARTRAGLFGIPPSALPEDWTGFERYVANAMDELRVEAGGRALGESVLRGAGTWVRVPGWYRALTAWWLTPELREAFGLAFGHREQAAVRRAAWWVPRVYRLLPRGVRFVGPWWEAQVRLEGRGPGWWVRRNNRFWMGRERMLFPERSGFGT